MNKEQLIERCKAAIELADMIGTEPIVTINAVSFDDPPTIEWNGLKGEVIGGIVFDAQSLLNRLVGGNCETESL